MLQTSGNRNSIIQWMHPTPQKRDRELIAMEALNVAFPWRRRNSVKTSGIKCDQVQQWEIQSGIHPKSVAPVVVRTDIQSIQMTGCSNVSRGRSDQFLPNKPKLGLFTIIAMQFLFYEDYEASSDFTVCNWEGFGHYWHIKHQSLSGKN